MNRQLNNHTELKERIRALEALKTAAESYLLNEVRKTISVVRDPGTAIKSLASELARDKDFRKDLLKISLSAGTNYLGKFIQSQVVSDAIMSFVLTKINPEGSGKKAGVWKYVVRLLDKLKSTNKEAV